MLWLYLASIAVLIVSVVSITVAMLYTSNKLLIARKTYLIFLFLSSASTITAGNLVSKVIQHIT